MRRVQRNDEYPQQDDRICYRVYLLHGHNCKEPAFSPPFRGLCFCLFWLKFQSSMRMMFTRRCFMRADLLIILMRNNLCTVVPSEPTAIIPTPVELVVS